MEVLEGNCFEGVLVRLTENKNRDRCHWEFPMADEVTVIMPGDRTQSYGRRVAVLHRQDGPLRRISDGSLTVQAKRVLLAPPRGRLFQQH